jgi:hypothetical protein
MYLPGGFNWAFRHNYPTADKLFNGFDYGHAILYEILYTTPNAPISKLEEDRYNFITRELLVHPPHVPLEEAAIEVAYAKIAPEAKAMFDWAHLFHRQVYDVWADERLNASEKDAKVAELLTYYKTRKDLAFSSKPKTMELMEGQPYSLAFRQKYPKFNGLIWTYHWLQVGLYEPLIVGKDKNERVTGVTAAVARFWQMIEAPPSNMPRIMPMTAAVAPRFAERYPEAGIIFDNLHAMHDVISDILASDKVSRSDKRAAVLRAARRYRDDTSFVMTVAEWKDMAQMMGIENMGGPVGGVLPGFPAPTVERGASMVGMKHGNIPNMANMPGMKKDTAGQRMQNMQNMPGMRMPPTPKDSAGRRVGHVMTDSAMRMDSMPMMNPAAMRDMMAMHERMMRDMMELHERMMNDPVIRQRIMADTAMRRLMGDTSGMAMPTMKMPNMKMPNMKMPNTRSMEHEGHAKAALMRPPATRAVTPKKTGGRTAVKTTAKAAPAKSTAAKKPQTKKPQTKKDPATDHTKMKMPGMPGMKKP